MVCLLYPEFGCDEKTTPEERWRTGPDRLTFGGESPLLKKNKDVRYRKEGNSMANEGNLVEHHASITVNAPVHQVYSLFTHFNDFPKFMSFVKEVTYYDDQRSHWVAEVAGRYEWDAVNENWVEDRQIGWHSTSGLENYGRVTF